jgi:phosphopantetheinyl transferase
MKTTDVDVYLANIRTVNCEAMAGQLDDDSRERLSRLSHPRRRAQFILVRRLLGAVLLSQFGEISKVWHLDMSSPKPRIVGPDAPEISLSHSREWVACAVARVEVGLDVEHCRERDFSSLVEHIYDNDPEALRRFLTLSGNERRNHFYRMWTLKEATFKLHGQVTSRHETGASTGGWDGDIRHEYFCPGDDFLGALAVRSGNPIRLMMHIMDIRPAFMMTSNSLENPCQTGRVGVPVCELAY